ncbi:MAG TPA: glutamate--tRNA ligase family protein, partial [Ilumatobacteraceae bacterium]|nr:glutamate--tRNA ligase family protein [Ilumatobacteraceae bacterium]
KVAVEQYRAEGYLADAMINYLMTLGWAPSGDTEIVPWSQIVADFRLEDVNHSPAFFDIKKLTAFNGEYIRSLPVDQFVAACAPFLTSSPAAETDGARDAGAAGADTAGVGAVADVAAVGSGVAWPSERFDPVVFAAIAPLVQTRVGRLDEVPAMVDFLFLADPVIDDDAFAKAFGTAAALDIVRDSIVACETIEWSHGEIKEVVDAIGTGYGLKLGKTQAPIRVAVTGRSVGPPLFEAIELLGRDETLRRLRAALTRAEAAPE